MISDLINTQDLENLLNKNTESNRDTDFLPLLKLKALSEHKGLFKKGYKPKVLTTEEQIDQAEKNHQWNQDNDYEVFADMSGSPANDFYFDN